MRRLFSIFLSLTVIFILTGCSDDSQKLSQSTSSGNSSAVTVNMPVDDTVNGYKDPDKSAETGTVIKVTDVTAVEESYYLYCANTSSKKFHKENCSFLKNTDEENKYYTNNREELINDGYTPCKRCEP